MLAACKPLYRSLPGWKQDISACTAFGDLPKEAKAYIAAVEETTGVPVKIVSVGPGREQTIIRQEIL
jgi:adenylosuccinate synthase